MENQFSDWASMLILFIRYKKQSLIPNFSCLYIGWAHFLFWSYAENAPIQYFFPY